MLTKAAEGSPADKQNSMERYSQVLYVNEYKPKIYLLIIKIIGAKFLGGSKPKLGGL